MPYIWGMFDILRKLFRDDGASGAAVVSPQRAVAALLVEAAHVDGRYEIAERALVGRLLAAMFGLDAAAAEALRAGGEADQAAAPDLVRFTRIVKTLLDEHERVRVIEALWSVVLSDGHRDPREDALLRSLAPLLGVSDRDSAFARQRVLGSAD